MLRYKIKKKQQKGSNFKARFARLALKMRGFWKRMARWL